MSLLDKASLIVTPNAYKESKLYSVVPSSGAGDMDVVRATTATRVNSAGLIEVVPRNLFTYSEQFDNAAWTKINATVTANATTAPNGMLTADKLIATAVSGLHIALQTPTGSISGENFTTSVFVKASGLSRITLLNNQGGGGIVDYNLTTGTFTLVSGVSASIQSLDNGWYRCIMTFTPNSTGNFNLQVRLADSSGNTTFTGNGVDGVFVWGFQVEQGSTATEYFPTTTRLNIPRIDYTNGSCPSLLVEPQRSNLLTYSNDYSDASWGKAGLTITLGTQVNPQGIASTYSISNTTLGDSYLQKTGLSTTAGNYTMSVFVKNIDNVATTQLMAVHLTQGSVTSEFTYTWATNTFVLSGTNAISGSSVLFSNGWVRLTFTYSIGAGVINHWNRLYANRDLAVTKSALVYGFQCESGNYPTSYIPTVASTVTRNADLGTPSTFNSTYTLDGDFCLYQDLEMLDFANSIYWSGGNYASGADFRSYLISYSSSNFVLFGVSEVITARLSTFNFQKNTRYKIAIRRVGSTIKWFVNGLEYANGGGTTTTTLKIRSINDTSIGGQGAMRLKTASIFKTALTDAECIALTTL